MVNKDELLEIYETGVGKIKIRGKIEFEKGKAGKTKLVITEIPYPMIGANISKFLTDIVALIDAKKTNDILDISNQSSKEGIRIVLELRKDADVENLKNMLLKKTRLEDTFGVNMLAVADGRPETLGLKDIIRHHVDFQREIRTRKYKNLLQKELDKKEIQEGLIHACDVIDLIIEILRGSKDVKTAKACLTEGKTEGITFKSRISRKMAEQLKFTERQADAILSMRLYKLIGLELEALMKEHEETLKNIELYKDILTNPRTMDKLIIKELDSYKKEYGRERRTAIENAEAVVFEEKKIEEAEVMFLMDRFGYSKTIDVSAYEKNKDTVDAENKYIIPVMNTGRICLFTNTGQLHTIKVLDLPHGKLKDKGIPVDNVSNYSSSDEAVVYACDLKTLIMQKLCFATKRSMLKHVYGTEFDITKRSVAATGLNDDDEVVAVFPIIDEKNVVLRTRDGYFLKFPLDDIPLKKKGAVGVRGMKLTGTDEVTDVYPLKNGVEQVVEIGGRRIELNKLKLARRDAKGTKVRV